MNTTQTLSDRARYIDGLRVLAAALEEHPEIPLPTDGTILPLSFVFLHDGDPRAAMAAAARALPCSWRKRVSGDETVSYFKLAGQVAGLQVELTAYRDAVCRKVVTGTREVTEEVPDPDAPKITRTRTVEDVEWDCGPVLGKALNGNEPAAVTQ
jgi:hypothetical protein